MKDIPFKVLVRCFTFNHSAYIKDALDGFCIQQTNFPFVCAIVDDCSTDGEQDVIRSYYAEHFLLENPEIANFEETDDYSLIFVRHKENVNCYFAVFFLKYNHYSIKKKKSVYLQHIAETIPYEALCEGDDYWIHPQKLQRQVSLMDSDKSYSMCFTADALRWRDGKVVENRMYPQDMTECPISDWLRSRKGGPDTAAMMFRLSTVRIWPEWRRNAPVGDIPIKLISYSRGKVGYINEVMSVYRKNVPGSWSDRVVKNRKNQLIIRKNVLAMYTGFDEWSEGKFHTDIMIRKLLIRIDYLAADLKGMIHKK